MAQVKRSQANTAHDHNDIKKRKLNITTDGYVRVFEDLSNEVVYEVFEYLDFHSSFQAFSDLNQRFQNLFIYSNHPIKINISSISKLNFHRYLTHIIEPYSDRIQSFRISTPFAADMTLLLLPILKHFTRLETLIINNIESKYIERIINHLSTLSVLSSLSIVSLDNVETSNEIYRKIFRLSALKYCQIAISTKWYSSILPVAVDEFSSIEHLCINNEIGLEQLGKVLSYVPNLRRLSIKNLNGFQSNWKQRSSMELHYITHVSLILHSVSFTDLELMIQDCFRQITHLVTYYACSHIDFTEYADADRWERLISTSIPNLRIFDCQIRWSSWVSTVDHQLCDALVRQFDSLFWTTHQWFFEHYYYITGLAESMMFFSTNPYRRKKYMLYEASNGDIDSHRIHTNMSSVQHLCIHNNNAVEQFMGSFPNATELTISTEFNVICNSIVTDLNRIVSLRKLTKLTLDYCLHFPFEHFIELLTFTPNINTLNIHAILLHRADSLSIQQTNIFRLVSSTNIITTLTIDEDITLEKVQLATVVFSRLESLTINLPQEQSEPIIRYVLSKPNNNTRFLSTLCIANNLLGLYEHLQLFLQSEKLLKDYILKFIDERLYLWW